ncbi:NACHT domain-containing protein [Apiospora marii]|uniref:NACHT domain-containing protein n=1 Tax=Apiospora marii TaxID=335849 RepID=A0ABR1RKM5_9PEZI
MLKDPICSFRSWLREPNAHHAYWICGASGSGKSTLIQSIAAQEDDDNEIKAIVVTLAPSPSGSQRSRAVDIYRCIMYEVLRSYRYLVPLIFPRAWSKAYCNSLGYAATRDTARAARPTSDQGPLSWGLEQLEKAVDWLFNQDIIPFRACLLIDGLDEYLPKSHAEDNTANAEIDALLGRITRAAWPNAKCGVATRPSLTFSAAFEDCPSLRMAELTGPAIRRCALDCLSSHEAFRCGVRGLNEHNALRQCVAEIAAAADGVFLWAEMAVSAAMRDHKEGDGMRKLRGKIRGFPRRLEDSCGRSSAAA